jgi:hypothetical protein
MVSNATLENARDGTEKIIVIADEDFKKVVLGKELFQTPNAKIKLNNYLLFTTVQR